MTVKPDLCLFQTCEGVYSGYSLYSIMPVLFWSTWGLRGKYAIPASPASPCFHSFDADGFSGSEVATAVVREGRVCGFRVGSRLRWCLWLCGKIPLRQI